MKIIKTVLIFYSFLVSGSITLFATTNSESLQILVADEVNGMRSTPLFISIQADSGRSYDVSINHTDKSSGVTIEISKVSIDENGITLTLNASYNGERGEEQWLNSNFQSTHLTDNNGKKYQVQEPSEKWTITEGSPFSGTVLFTGEPSEDISALTLSINAGNDPADTDEKGGGNRFTPNFEVNIPLNE